MNSETSENIPKTAVHQASSESDTRAGVTDAESDDNKENDSSTRCIIFSQGSYWYIECSICFISLYLFILLPEISIQAPQILRV